MLSKMHEVITTGINCGVRKNCHHIAKVEIDMQIFDDHYSNYSPKAFVSWSLGNKKLSCWLYCLFQMPWSTCCGL